MTGRLLTHHPVMHHNSYGFMESDRSHNEGEYTTTKKPQFDPDNIFKEIDEMFKGSDSMNELFNRISTVDFRNILEHTKIPQEITTPSDIIEDEQSSTKSNSNQSEDSTSNMAQSLNPLSQSSDFTDTENDRSTTTEINITEESKHNIDTIFTGVDRVLKSLDSINRAETMDDFLNQMSNINFNFLLEEVTTFSSHIENENAITEQTSASESLKHNVDDFNPNVLQAFDSPVMQPVVLSHSTESDIVSTSETPTAISSTIPTVVTESSLESQTEIATPYGVICFPMLFNEVNEFGVTVTIERPACYPAPEPVIPTE